MSGHVRELKEAKALLALLVPRYCQSQEEDGLLVQLRRAQEVTGWRTQGVPGH